MDKLLSKDTMNISSNIQSISEVENLIDSLSSCYKFSDDVYGKLLLSIVEAVNNAVIHGNQSDESKHVGISYVIDSDEVTFTVSDEGEGFNPAIVPDPTAPENLEKPCGRGIYLMKHLSDDICFSDNGRCVTLKFSLK